MFFTQTSAGAAALSWRNTCGRTLYSTGTASGGRASLQLWALSLRSCKVSVGCAPVLRRPLNSADVVANIAAAAVPTAAAAAVPAAERGRETKGHGSKAEAPHL